MGRLVRNRGGSDGGGDMLARALFTRHSVYMNIHLIFYYIGISIVILSHIYMLTIPSMRSHALLNLFAAACIAYYFMNKEGFIKV